MRGITTPIKLNMKKTILILSIILLVITFATAQNKPGKIVRVTGTAQVKMEANMTRDAAYEKAKELAKIDAIQKAFGTYVEQQSDMSIANGRTSYNIIGTTKVKGEWIETIDESYKQDSKTEKTPYGIQEIPWITCTIKGKARKAIPKAQIKYDILNSPNPASRTLSFYDREQLYLWFKSPVNGYLTIFLEDDDAIYRLLPYLSMNSIYQSGVRVKGDEEYLFFSPDYNTFNGYNVDELILNLNKETVEYNSIYLIFSQNPFAKPILHDSKATDDKILPRSLSKEEFQSWLAHNRSLDASFQDKKIKISIQNKN